MWGGPRLRTAPRFLLVHPESSLFIPAGLQDPVQDLLPLVYVQTANLQLQTQHTK